MKNYAKRCKRCGSIYPAADKNCPNCGHQQITAALKMRFESA